MRRLRRLSGALLLIGSAAALMAAAALAQDDERIEDLRQQREQLARDAADVASQIDALVADDEALIDALQELDDFVDLQHTRIQAAESAILTAEAEAAAARAEAEWYVDEIETIRERLRQRAIQAYVQPPVDVVEQFSTSLNESAVKLFLLDLAIGNELEITDELRTAEAQLEVVRRRALDRAEDADEERQAQQQRLADLEDARAAAMELRLEIQSRIEEWNLVSADIERSDKEMEQEIFRIEEEIRRREEERRRQEEEARRRAIEEERRRHEAEHGPFELVAWPADGEKTSGFGPRVHPIFGTVRQHNGIDLGGDTGDRVRAARSGEVILAGQRGGFGNTIVIYHGLGYSTLYAHLSRIEVSEGQNVQSGDRIGAIGSTGWSTGPHLHFELRIDGKAVDPTPYLP
ncbi:MAG: peptidoglycan DD-metalloendopeptidase family protein [Acidimicrobiaceae bacterium]|nr:peptidoglycan DD-metalloendopeptidase family protein [Acidimicrobiaceae bacterium]MDE0515416.1 peptidoglycan DD-metalloendopeptidase family protein [Acidimicrobiaceae bacterium]MDE0657219.1 peptidoglycan DD-metalloendopeptidase family protein [Acidimicrobiaceae bacterium]MXZ94917.1 peptidoglycan DD-metalloendopeptidase family protein [Acidimicrobiaceae bacterium]MYF42303.1 peptidoglycan DD-metalloendopeptidase family protein [Acidimicrobiaceae bacterium]